MLPALSHVNAITDSDCTLSAVRHLTALLAVDSFFRFHSCDHVISQNTEVFVIN